MQRDDNRQQDETGAGQSPKQTNDQGSDRQNRGSDDTNNKDRGQKEVQNSRMRDGMTEMDDDTSDDEMGNADLDDMDKKE